MADIQLNDSALSQASAQWFIDAPTDHGVPPVPMTPSTDPISAGVMAAIADWPGVHEALAAARSAKVAHLLGANGGTSTTLTTTDIENAASITTSAEG
jgi:hypothetical protein